MQKCRDESEIYNYQQIQLWNNSGCDVCTSHMNSILILYARMKE